MEKYRTLFLDRDGVINEERPDDYIKTWEEFIFLPSVLTALPFLKERFSHIFIVTNQRGVGKGIMQLNALESIHRHMLQIITKHGGRIDRIYVCTDIESDSPDRKPNIGMALRAKAEFPDINFSESIMVGNSISDLKFARNAGMTSILVGKKYPDPGKTVSLRDYYFNDLYAFSQSPLCRIL